MQPSQRAALRIAVVYAAVAMAWILLSDSLVSLFPHPADTVLQTGKGLLFVLVTTVTLFFLVLHSARELSQASNHAASAERMLEQVVQTVPVGVVVVDGEGGITFLNATSGEFFGCDPIRSVGMAFEATCFPDHPGATELLGEIYRTGGADGIDIPATAGRAQRILSARAAELDPAVPGTGWILAFTDMSGPHLTHLRLQRLVNGHRFLTDAAVAMSKAVTPADLLRDQCALAVRSGGYTGAWAAVRKTGSHALTDLGVTGLDSQTGDVSLHLTELLDQDGSHLVERFASGEPHVINDLARDPADPFSAFAEAGAGSMALIVLSQGEGAVAAIALLHRDAGHFDADQVALVRTLRGALKFALEKLSLDARRLDAEEALVNSERRFRQLFERAAQPMWVFDHETLVFLAVNDAAIRKYGYSRDEFLGMTAADIRPSGEIARLHVSVTSTDDGTDDVGIWRHVDSSGRVFPVHIYPHTVDWNGRVADLIIAIEAAETDR